MKRPHCNSYTPNLVEVAFDGINSSCRVKLNENFTIKLRSTTHKKIENHISRHLTENNPIYNKAWLNNEILPKIMCFVGYDLRAVPTTLSRITTTLSVIKLVMNVTLMENIGERGR